ncbi:MAG: Gmad2 immunoglobulin-like domain-containing protein [Chloroflexi bacterium]|nr:Gmad2 immunoglobulin-like domain-containing protein [Chloroflexota bacterium]
MTISRLRWIAGIMALSLALLLSACGATESTEELQSDETSAAGAATPAAQTATKSTAPATTTAESGEAVTPDARIAGIRFGQHPEFDRLVIDFAIDQGSANAVPHWLIEKAPGEGVLRIHLPTVTETAFTDAQVADKLDWFTHVYVVRAPDGSLFVDVFIPAEYQVRVQEVRDPLRLVIDVAPGGDDTHILPATAKNTVLITPRPGATLQGTVTVSGYSRNFEANNVIILQDSAGKEIDRAIVTSTDYIEAWGYFSKELEIPAGTGTGTLLVGDFDAQDGKFDGVTIPVQFGGE